MGTADNQTLSIHPDRPLSSGGEYENVPVRPQTNTTTFPPSESNHLPLSMATSFPQLPALSRFLSSGSLQFKAGVVSESLLDAPKPLESLCETPIPPFLSKTYDLVDDPCLDAIISWGEKGDSFVVWEPEEFARMILPRNFKHNNFSSFVRQLNTYGFRKIDADKWEFTNKGFVKGQRHLLSKIQRRKSHQSQHTRSSSGSFTVSGKAALEVEVGSLRKERSSMMWGLVQLQHQQRDTTQHMEKVMEQLEAAEKRQKQMVSFLVKMLKKPAFLACLQRPRNQNSISPRRSTRKYVKHRPHESGTSPEEQFVTFLPELCNITVPTITPDAADRGDGLFYGAEQMPAQVEGIEKDELAMVHEFQHTSQQADLVATLGTTDSLLKEKDVMSLKPQSTNECSFSFPEDMVMEKSVPEYLMRKTENESMAIADASSMGLIAGANISGSWGNLTNYDVLELGVGSEYSDVCDIGSLQSAGSSGLERWLDEDSQISLPMDDGSKNMNP